MAANVARAATYYQDLARKAGTVDEALVVLAEALHRAHLALERCLRGFDAFDTLSFLRMAVSPWDFTDLNESQSHVDSSQAAQDVVALTLLGMGLPRTPLTGENSGQPDVARTMARAGDVVQAAATRALFQGRRVDQPLGALAGEFMAYELSVRGRQYASIAAEFNTELLGQPAVSTALVGALGFTLGDLRAVREASVALLNQRFFDARDRVGEATRSDASPVTAVADAFRQDMNMMVNECRLFGAISAADAARGAAVPEAVATAVLDFFSAARLADGEPNPVTAYAEGALPMPWGSIRDDGEYLILNGFLGEDELRRHVERGLVAGRSWPTYNRRRAAYAESKTAGAFGDLLSGAVPLWTGQKYLGPVNVADAARLGRRDDPSNVQTRQFESDLLFVVDGIALCVEVKAGSITARARAGNAKRLATDLEKTLKHGNEQADRLTRLVRTNHGVWAADGRWIDLSACAEVHSIIVMLDDMGPLSLSMHELARRGIIDTADVPWIVSLHDLVVMSRTFDHPAQFVEYLRRRRGRKLATMVKGVDELDMFMWFLNGGMYFEPHPQELAEQLPIDGPADPSAARRHEQQAPVRLGTLTDPLDAWFYGQEGLSQVKAPKPSRREERWVEQYLAAAEGARSPGWLRFGADLVGLSQQAQRDVGRALKVQRRRARGGRIERSITTHGTTSVGSWLMTACVVPDGAATDHLVHYVEDKQYQTRSSRAMLLLYTISGKLTGSRYRGDLELRTSERDAAVAASGLYSLQETFGGHAPGPARRKGRRPGIGGTSKPKRQ